ncbi:MAG: HD domain-containing protein [Candidatus Nanoarchaeia archaeon]|nr:HD domain-containing protein [Candidatus Nanoarchaeia archaeon]
MDTIIEKAKQLFLKSIDNFGSDPYRLKTHVPEVERWAKYLLTKYKADKEIVLISVWFHDIGHYPLPYNEDHAIRSEKIAKQFLENNNYTKTKEVLHCIRAHRCNDIPPETIEAKIVAFCDSASHITDPVYFNMAKDFKIENRKGVIDKIKRDYRDLGFFPEIQQELKPLVESWENLIKIYEQIDFI